MKTIIIAYWHSKIDGIPYKHLQEITYHGPYDQKINEILSICLSSGVSVMIRPTDNGIYMWLNKGLFRDP
jgi:hypothetical protein